MSLLTSIANFALSSRLRAIDRFRAHGSQVQAEQLGWLVERGARTAFGREHGLHAGMGADEFAKNVPVRDYEALADRIDRARRGEADVLWPGTTRWFAKSSGTTAERSKYIPVTQEGLEQFHLQGPRDVMAVFTSLYPNSNVLSGKMLTLGGSSSIEREGDTSVAGDLSAILIENTPFWADLRRVPSRATALVPDFEQKVQAICRETIRERVTSFAGVPSWNLVLMNRVLEHTGATHILEVWPEMEVFIHGGIRFDPYREQYRRLFPSSEMKYLETYNASEGFFALADEPSGEDMLLMLDYRIYYEFLPLADLGSPEKAVPLEGVRPGVHYAMIITTSCGLWRYLIGDVVEFTSTTPYRIRITGRTRHYINAFGEEVIVDNADAALRAACAATGAEAPEYTVAPVYMEGRSKGRHEWLVEFIRRPRDMDRFVEVLDDTLRARNSDYDAKRSRDTTLLGPLVRALPEGTFEHWMAARGKKGGQNKVPRLSNDRKYVDEILEATGLNAKGMSCA